MKRICLTILLAICLVAVAACSVAPEYPAVDSVTPNYVFDGVTETDFVLTSHQPTSYFSLDTSTASYSLMRRQLTENMIISGGSVRLEEFINYFSYDYARPQQDELAVSGSLFACPWQPEHKLFSVGVAAEEVTFLTPNNVVFLVDTSGSMFGKDRLSLIQQAFALVLDSLTENDVVSIVTYAGDFRIALEGARGNEKTKIANALQALQADGSTNGSGGISAAYQLAQKYFIQGGNNRIVLATDGDFNLGITNKDQLKSLVRENSQNGIFLSVFGVGMFNLNDSVLKSIAENGNGNYVYLDSIAEARKCLVEEFNGTFNVVAKDAKIAVEFNPNVVESYRLIGYESGVMSQEEFEDEGKNAGEIGSGHSVTAVYELVLKADASGNVATAEVRYKTAENVNKSVKTDISLQETATEDNIFIGCVVEFGLLLRQSQFIENASFASVIERLQALPSVTGDNADPFRAEFLQLVRLAQNLYTAE